MRKSLIATLCALIFLGCGETVHSKHYTSHFKLSSPIALHADSLEPDSIRTLFEKNGYTIDTQSVLHVSLSTDPIISSCPVGASPALKEHFVRISILLGDVEHYRIQLNQKEPITLKDIEKVIVKMKREVGA